MYPMVRLGVRILGFRIWVGLGIWVLGFLVLGFWGLGYGEG